MQAKNGNQPGFSVSEEQMRRILGSQEGKQLLMLLQNGGDSVRRAAEAAKNGDTASAKRALDTLLKDPKTASLVERLRHG